MSMSASNSRDTDGSREAESSHDGDGSRGMHSGHLIAGDNGARNTTGDTCSYYKPAGDQACRQPRSCFDCLNAKITTDTASDGDNGCVLAPSGMCQSINAYIPALDYRTTLGDASADATATMNYFPSPNTTYCAPQDAACARCGELAAQDRSDMSAALAANASGTEATEALRRFCVGEDGCVCVAVCESVSWKKNMQEDCDGTGDYGTGEVESYRSILPIFMVVQIVLIVMVIYRQAAYHRRLRRRMAGAQAAHTEGPYNNAAAISSPSNRLELTGWRAMQAELVQREKARRGLVSLMSPANEPTGEDQQAGQTYATGGTAIDNETADDFRRTRDRRSSTMQSFVMLEGGRASDVDRSAENIILEEPPTPHAGSTQMTPLPSPVPGPGPPPSPTSTRTHL